MGSLGWLLSQSTSIAKGEQACRTLHPTTTGRCQDFCLDDSHTRIVRRCASTRTAAAPKTGRLGMPTVTQECGTDAVSKSATTPEARSFPLIRGESLPRSSVGASAAVCSSAGQTPMSGNRPPATRYPAPIERETNKEPAREGKGTAQLKRLGSVVRASAPRSSR